MRKSVKLLTGTIGLAGGAAMGLAMPGTAVAATQRPANASGCTLDAVGLQCMIIKGSHSYVRTAKESQSKLTPPFTMCDYTAKWRGDRNSAGHKGWTTFYGATHHGCTAAEAWISKKIGHIFKPGTGFYGYWKSTGTNHHWTTPVKEKIGR
jgi:hypothetical protein